MVNNVNDVYEELDMLIEKGDKRNLNKKIKSLDNINMKDKDGQTLLEYAVLRGNRKLTKALLSNGAYINTNDPKLIEYAALAGNEKLIKTLMKYDVNINAVIGGESALKSAVDRNNVNMFEILVNNGANIRYNKVNGKPLLMYAVMNGAHEIVKKIVKMTNYLDEVDGNMETALMHAVRNGDKDMVNILLDAGANIKRENLQRETPLIIAIKNHDSSMKDLLLKRGASMDEKNIYEGIALMMGQKSKEKVDAQIDDYKSDRESVSKEKVNTKIDDYKSDRESVSSTNTDDTIIIDGEKKLVINNKLTENSSLKYERTDKSNKINDHRKNSSKGMTM